MGNPAMTVFCLVVGVLAVWVLRSNGPPEPKPIRFHKDLEMSRGQRFLLILKNLMAKRKAL